MLQNLFSNMLNSLKAEEGHTESSWVESGIALGRVSINTLNPETQPVCNEDGRLWAVLDGEIYNHQYQPLKRMLVEAGHIFRTASDVELLLHLYEEKGDCFISTLNGTFNLAIWDSLQQKLIIANDRYGTRPLYYSNGQNFCFASKIQALLHNPQLNRTVNEEAIIEFFTFRHSLGDKTPFVDIKFLPPASRLIYQAGNYHLSTYWTPNLEAQKQPDRNRAAYAEQLTDLLHQAVARCLHKKRDIGFMLSGGLDSRLLVGLADPQYQPFHTFTRGIPGCDDVRYGQAIAHEVGSIHHFVEIDPDFLSQQAERGVRLTDGLMAATDFYELSTIDQVASHVNTVIFGIPAAPLEGLGLNSSFFDLNIDQITEKIYSSRGVFISDKMQPQLFSERFYHRIKGVVAKNLQQVLQEAPFDSSQAKAEFYLLRHYSPRSAMHGPTLTRSKVETCFPFADADVLDFIYTIPLELRLGRQLEIDMFRFVPAGLSRIPWQYSGLPVRTGKKRVRLQRALYHARRELSWLSKGLISVPQRKEQANWPVWLRTNLRPWLEDMLLSKRTLERGYFNPAGLKAFLDEHSSGRRDRTYPLGMFVTFELWNRLFVDGEIT
ncbi:MAG: hypothetical protein KDJ97_08875 [Anaerolineae bacterium]|nr:hypothetical protein [Anaerolineae bacterium]